MSPPPTCDERLHHYTGCPNGLIVSSTKQYRENLLIFLEPAFMTMRAQFVIQRTTQTIIVNQTKYILNQK